METLVNKNNFIIQQPQLVYSKSYEIEITQKIISESDVNENITSYNVKKSLIKKDAFGFLYSLDITKRKQSNQEGLRGMEYYLSLFQKKIILYVDELGQFKSIVNLKEIEEQWITSRSDFKKRFKKTPNISEIIERLNLLFSDMESFIKVFNQSELVSLLFPPVYTEFLTTESYLIQQKNYEDFFGAISLPLLIKTEIIKLPTKDNKALKMSRQGHINKSLFKEDEIKQFFRNHYQKYNLIVDFDINYIELLDLDSKYVIDYAMQIFSVKIGGVYLFEQFSKVITVKE
ncbi:hypothetical protein [uncultured Lacinutrix sp.]|uniref:hypothetical protein n=1 Tax=uncultured Lacinutrix sp. TaxID=574032 RepID=UPI0026256130|nr:hypothetical protein [uncultured Lacinutrix sp.]